MFGEKVIHGDEVHCFNHDDIRIRFKKENPDGSFQSKSSGTETSNQVHSRNPSPPSEAPSRCTIRSLPNAVLLERLENLVSLERKTTAEILEHIREVDRRRLYISLGHTSLFSYLTKCLGYTPASAQRRIDAARVLRDLPEIKEDLRSGEINLMQVSMLAQSIRQKQKAEPDIEIGTQLKKEILQEVKSKDINETQRILSAALELEPIQQEKKKHQRDESVRFEITFSKEQFEMLNRIKDIVSHKHPNPTWAELIEIMGKEFLKHKDPAREKRKTAKAISKPPKTTASDGNIPTEANTEPNTVSETPGMASVLGSTSKMVAEGRQEMKAAVLAPKRTRDLFPANPEENPLIKLASNAEPQPARKQIPAQMKRDVHQRDHGCQWVDKNTGERCSSRYQLEIDHITPVWAGGTNSIDNLQILCKAHNRRKYHEQAGIRPRY